MPVTFTTAESVSVSVTSHSATNGSSTTGLISLLEGVSSHSTASSSEVSRLLALNETVNSHSTTLSSASTRNGLGYSNRTPPASYSTTLSGKVAVLLSLYANAQSHTAPFSASTTRDGVSHEGRIPDASFAEPGESDSIALISLLAAPSSHAAKSISFTYNERTSLEVVDFEIIWDENQSLWYTNWFQESKILGDEDTLAIRSLVVDGAKEPCAKIVVEYDGTGDGKPDEFSDPIEVGREEDVKLVEGIPIDTDGHYRFRIMEYSGYNSIYNLNLSIVH